MMGFHNFWRLLSGQAEREAAQRNREAYEKVRQCYGLDDHLDEINTLMREASPKAKQPTGTNGTHRTNRKQGWE